MDRPANCFPGESYYVASTPVRTQSGLLLRHTLGAEIGISAEQNSLGHVTAECGDLVPVAARVEATFEAQTQRETCTS